MKTTGTSPFLPGRVSIEQRLLLACARLKLEPADQDAIAEALSGRIDWDQVVEGARWHKLEGLLFHHLRDHPLAGRVPPEVMASFKGFYSRNVARYMYYRAELGRILAELKSHGIPVIVLKGAELAETIYKDPGLRPMVDVDLLVPREQSAEAYATVQRMGYRPVVGAEEQSRMQERDRQLAALAGIGKPVIVEIHTHVVEVDNPLRLDIGVFWSETHPATIAGQEVLLLKPEAELAYLSYNFFKDRRYYSYSAIGQLCDIAESCRSAGDSVHWDMLARGSKFEPMIGPVFCSLYLASRLLRAPVPEQFLARIQPDGFKPVDAERLAVQRVLNRTFMARQLVQPAQPEYGLMGALGGALRRAVPPKAYMAQRYNLKAGSKRVYFYYPRRMVEGLWIAASMVVRPRRLSDDLAVDRWLHDLHHAGSSSGKGFLVRKISGQEPAQPAGSSIGGRG